MKKIILICIMILCIFANPAFTQTEDKPKGHTFYSQELSKKVYPFIKEYLSQYNKQLTKDDADKIVDELYTTIIELIGDNLALTPSLQVIRILTQDNVLAGYVLEITLVFYDYEETAGHLLGTVVYKKSFIIYQNTDKSNRIISVMI